MAGIGRPRAKRKPTERQSLVNSAGCQMATCRGPTYTIAGHISMSILRPLARPLDHDSHHEGADGVEEG